MDMLIAPCTIKNFNVKDGDTILNVVVSNAFLETNDIAKLFELKQCKLNLALAYKYEKEEFQKDLDQLDFTVICPDCRSYDCVAGEKIGLCKTCGKEFSLNRPDAKRQKLKIV